MKKCKFLMFLFALALIAGCKPKDPEVLCFDQENYLVSVGDSILVRVKYSASSMTNVTWQLGDTKIAKLSDYQGNFSYYVKGLQAGSTQLVVRGKETEAKCNILVGRIPLETITLTDTLRLMVGQTDTVKCTLTPANTTDIFTSWLSKDSKIASVDDQGIVTAVKVGETDVVFSEKLSGKSAKCHVVVLPIPVDSISSGKMNILIGDTVKMKYTVYPKNASNKKVTMASDNPAVLKVKMKDATTPTDTLIAVALGKANLTLTSEDGGKTSVYEITVTNIDAFVTLNLTGELATAEDASPVANVKMLFQTNHTDSVQLNSIELWNPMGQSVWSMKQDTTLVSFENIYQSERFLMKGDALDMRGWKCHADYTWRENKYAKEILLDK